MYFYRQFAQSTFLSLWIELFSVRHYNLDHDDLDKKHTAKLTVRIAESIELNYFV